MFKLSLSQFLFEHKVDGYHLYKRITPFNYNKVLDGGDKVDLINFLVEEDFNVLKPISKNEAKKVLKRYDSEIKDWHLRHLKNPIEENKKYGYGTFDDFIAEYTKHQLDEGWIRDPQYPESHFTKDHKCKIHCHYIVFDGVHMLLKEPKDFLKFLEWEKENIIVPNFSDNQVDKWAKNE